MTRATGTFRAGLPIQPFRVWGTIMLNAVGTTPAIAGAEPAYDASFPE